MSKVQKGERGRKGAGTGTIVRTARWGRRELKVDFLFMQRVVSLNFILRNMRAVGIF